MRPSVQCEMLIRDGNLLKGAGGKQKRTEEKVGHDAGLTEP